MDQRLFLFHLKNLFEKAETAFIYIKREKISGFSDLLRNYFLIFLILFPVSALLKQSMNFSSWKSLFLNGVLLPVVILLITGFILYFISIVMEEAGKFYNIRIEKLATAKLCFISAVPALSISLLHFLPVVGSIFPILGIIYWIYLIDKGSKTFFFYSANYSSLWGISILFSALVFISIILVGLGLLQLLF